jgi:hypothetical protein
VGRPRLKWELIVKDNTHKYNRKKCGNKCRKKRAFRNTKMGGKAWMLDHP